MNMRGTIAILSILLGSISYTVQAQDTPSDEPAPSEEVIVQVKGGDLIHGKLIGENDDSVVLVSPVLGTITLPRDQVETVMKNTPDAAAIAAAKAEAEKAAAAEAAKKAAEEAAKPKSPWKGTANVGFTYSDASSVTSSLNLGLNLERKTDLNTFLFEAKYFYSYDDGQVTDNDIFVNGDETYYFSKESPWSLFGTMTYQWDAFELWEHRLSPYGGVGYAFVRDDDLTWTGRFGAGGTWEYDGNRSFDPQFLFQTTVNWTIDKTQSIQGSAKIAPKMTEFSNYILTLQGNYRLRIGEDTPFSLNFSVLDIYDSDPGPDGNNNDLKLVVSLGYDF
jgi:putative salt-induced outer membrane protein YdiY